MDTVQEMPKIITVVLKTAGVPNLNGDIFTEEALKAEAERWRKLPSGLRGVWAYEINDKQIYLMTNLVFEDGKLIATVWGRFAIPPFLVP